MSFAECDILMCSVGFNNRGLREIFLAASLTDCYVTFIRERERLQFTMEL